MHGNVPQHHPHATNVTGQIRKRLNILSVKFEQPLKILAFSVCFGCFMKTKHICKVSEILGGDFLRPFYDRVKFLND